MQRSHSKVPENGSEESLLQKRNIQKTRASCFWPITSPLLRTPLVANGLWGLKQVNNLEYYQRRSILGLTNNISNEIIKNRTAYWYKRPLAKCIVDIIEKQQLLEQQDIELMKQSPCYHSQNKMTKTKTAQQIIKKEVDPETWTLFYALSNKKTITNWSVSHFCREHKKLSRESIRSSAPFSKWTSIQTRSQLITTTFGTRNKT